MGNLSRYNRETGAGGTVVHCCICSTPPAPFARDYHGNAIARCPACGLRFVSPRAPAKALLEHTYDADYYKLNGRRAPADDPRPDCREHLSRLHRWSRPPGRLLDIGSGDGSLLRAALDAGWDAEGIEMHPPLVEHDLKDIGCPVFAGNFEDFEPAHRYDAITLIHVLEHVLDPASFLLRCRSALEDDGTISVVVPNTASLNDRIKTWLSSWSFKSERWKHLAADHHLWFFTPRTLRRLAAKADLRVAALATRHPTRKSWPGASWLLRGMESAALGPWIVASLRK